MGPAHEIVLVRHGETGPLYRGRFVGRSNVPLGEAGNHQAAALAKRPELQETAACYVSPLRRARETVSLALPGRMSRLEADLREIDFGAWERMSFEEIAAQAPEVVEQWARFDEGFRFPGGESIGEFLARVKRVAEVLERRSAHGRVVAFTHGGVIRALICHWLGLPPENYVLFEVQPASVTTIKLFDGRGVLAGLNDRCHLAGMED